MGLSNAERQARWRARRAGEVDALRKAAEAPPAAPTSPELLEARREIVRLRNRIKALEASQVTSPWANKSAPDPDSEVARLTKANKALRAKLRHMHGFYEKESEKKGTMTFATYTKIMKCLHPDTTPTPGQRTEACGLLSQWQQSARSKRDAA